MHRAVPAGVMPSGVVVSAASASARAPRARTGGRAAGFRAAPLPGRRFRAPKALTLEPTGDGSTDHLDGVDSVPEASTISLVESGTVSVGREGTDILLTPTTVSKRHATLSISGKEVTVTDTGSLNGTYIDLQELAEGEASPLPIGSEVIFGDEFLAKYVLSDHQDIPAGTVAGLESKSEAPAAERPSQARLTPSAAVEAAESVMREVTEPLVPETSIEERKAEAQAWVKSWKAKSPAAAASEAPVEENNKGGVLGAVMGALLGSSSKDEEDAKKPAPIAADKPKAEQVRGWSAAMRDGQAMVARGVQGSEAEAPQVKPKDATPQSPPEPMPQTEAREAPAAAAPPVVDAAASPEPEASIDERKAEVKGWVSSWKDRSADTPAVAAKEAVEEAAVEAVKEVAVVLDAVEDTTSKAVGEVVDAPKEAIAAAAEIPAAPMVDSYAAAVYAVLASVHAAAAFVLMAAPEPVLQCCFAGTYTPPDMSLCTMCLRLSGALLLLPAAALHCLQKAARAGNLAAPTFERLNAGLVISGLLTTGLATAAAMGTLSIAPAVWGTAAVPFITAVAAANRMARATGGVGAVFSLVPSMLMGFPKRLASLPYTLLTLACLVMGTFLLFQPAAVHNAMVDETLLTAVIQWVKSLWDSTVLGIPSKSTLKMALLGIEPISPISEVLKRLSGAALLLAATAAFVLKDAADRSLLGAGTCKTLNKAFSGCSLITLLTLLYNFWPVWVSNAPEPTTLVIGICAAVAFSGVVTTVNWLFA